MTTTALRLGRFVSHRFPPHVYASYGVLWAAAFEGAAHLLSGPGTGWVPSAQSAVRIVTVVLVLLFMRMLDEQKDLEYDRTHNPRRPLVTGEVTATELRLWMAGTGLLLLALNVALSPVSVLLLALDLAYGLALAVLERHSAAARDGVLTNLALAYPIQVLLSCYLYGSLVSTGAITAQWSVVPLLLVFAGVFLQFEFARKTQWDSPSDARLYSTVFGPAASAAISVGLAVGAAALACVLFWPRSPVGWLPGVTVVFPAVGAVRFFVHRRSGGLLPPAMGFVLGSSVCLVVLAVAGPRA